MIVPAALPLTPLEIATGLVPGEGPALPPPEEQAATDPLTAIEDALRPALMGRGCVVAFFGGLDSALLLARATRLARREGLPSPAALTMRFPGRLLTDESMWQQLVADHVGLRDWEIVEPGDELDLLGPFARATLQRHGLLWSANAHVAAWLLRRAGGRDLVMGLDGDTAFGHWRWGLAAHVRWGGGRLTPRTAPSLALTVAPAAVRRPLLASRERVAGLRRGPDARFRQRERKRERQVDRWPGRRVRTGR